VQQEKEINLLYFQLLLNTGIKYFPLATSLKIPIISEIATIDFLQHPLLKIAQQQKSLSIANYKLEKSRLLPDINLGIFSMSMQGNGADNVFYNRSARFNSAQVGVGIPLFWGSFKSKIKATKLEGNIADNLVLLQTQSLQNQLEKLKIQFQNNTTIVNNYEEKGLENAILISKVANENFINGEINYLDWVMLNNQAITIQNNYLEAVKLLNESIISLNYMSSKF
jgi:cobalt-zinc-cadmium resistance protein CzcA